ncbi:MAG TPA: hypothetical protein VLB84_06595, partial [Bacteroidia bacterium]|nr:hypothetical protein [Bacteroidia bacterium]
MHNRPGKKVPKLILMSILWILLSLLGLVLLILIVIQFPGPQHFLTNKITTYVSTKINSRVEIGNLNIAFPKDISLTDLYVEDLHHDTLLYAHSIKINLNLFDLLSQKLELKDVSLEKLTAHIYREFPDTTFNYSFILNAFSASEEEKVPKKKSTKKGFEFSIRNVLLANTYITYMDTLSGTNTTIRLGTFKTNFDEFNLDKKKIFINEIQLKKSDFFLSQTLPLKADTNSPAPFQFDIGVKEVNLQDVKTTYLNKENLTDLRADIGKLKIQTNSIDLRKMSLDLKTIALSESAIVYTLNTTNSRDTLKKPIDQTTSGKTDQNTNLTIHLSKLELQSNSFAYNNRNKESIPEGMDFNHLRVHKIDMDASDISISPKKITLVLNDFGFKEEKGFTLKNFTTNLTYDDTHIELDKLAIQTDKSRIGNYILLTYPSLKSIQDSIGSLQTNILLENTVISISDILMFKPDLFSNSNFQVSANTDIHLDSKIKGKIDDLQIDQLTISTLNNTIIELKGNIQHARFPQQLIADIQLSKFTTSKSDLKNVLNDSLLPKNLSIPENIHITGDFKGSVKIFSAKTTINTSFGDAVASVKMNTGKNNSDDSFIATTTIDQFDLGKLFNNPELLGPLSMEATLNGNGLTDSSIHAQLNTTIQEAVFKKYAYKNLIVKGTINKKSFSGSASIDDKNLAFNYAGIINLDSIHPEYNFKFNLTGADLKALHLSDEDIRISAFIQSDLKREEKENITGTASIKNALIIKEDKKYQLDSILLTSGYDKGESEIFLTSDILNANLKGNITLSQLPGVLKKHLGNYFDLQQNDTLEKFSPQKFSFELNLTDPTILTEGLVPHLEKLTPFSVKGMYDSDAKKIQLDMDLPQVVYSKIIIDSLHIGMHSNSEALNYGITVAELSNPTEVPRRRILLCPYLPRQIRRMARQRSTGLHAEPGAHVLLPIDAQLAEHLLAV